MTRALLTAGYQQGDLRWLAAIVAIDEIRRSRRVSVLPPLTCGDKSNSRWRAQSVPIEQSSIHGRIDRVVFISQVRARVVPPTSEESSEATRNDKHSETSELDADVASS